MSALRILELRSLNRVSRFHRQLHITPPQQLSRHHSPVPLRRTTTPRSDASISHGLQQRRYQSSSPEKRSSEQKPPPPSFKLILQALRKGLNFRPLFGAFRGQNLRDLFRQSPEELTIAFVLLACAAGVCVYVVYAYFTYFQSEQFTRFPPEIAKSLRRALYYSNYSPEPPLALKWYKIALEQCKAARLDPFSDEVMGIRIQVAAWLEKLGNYHNSIEVLDTLLEECKKWVELMEKSVQDGLIDKSGHLIDPENSKNSSLVTKSSTASDNENGGDKEPVPEPENLWGKRRRVLARSVGISAKLGELYADEHVLQSDVAGERLIWAVETILKEMQRRQVEGVKEGEGDWMSPEETGGALEALGNHYESKSQHYLAAPLFLQAITLSPPTSCHTAVLSKLEVTRHVSTNRKLTPKVNNLAISLAQQPVNATATTTKSKTSVTSEPASQTPTRAALLSGARQWALQAEATSRKVEGEARTEECDEACAVALCNLADIAAMSGDLEEARRRFKESLELSKKIGFEPAIVQAQDGLKRVST